MNQGCMKEWLVADFPPGACLDECDFDHSNILASYINFTPLTGRHVQQIWVGIVFPPLSTLVIGNVIASQFFIYV